jgi:GT2 family glycosyltransferase
MNPDCIATKCWLEEMNKVLDKYEDVVQVSPDSNQYYNEKLFWRIVRWQIKRRFPKLGDRIYRYLLYFNPPRSSDHYEFKDTGDAFYLFCGGFCNLIRTKYFRDLGYILDPKIVHGYGDDFDLSYYLRQFGKIGSVNSSYVFHFVNTSLRKLNTHSLKDKVKFLNRMYVIGKWNDRLRKDISNLDQETLFNLVQNHPEVNFMVQYFGLIDINPKLEPYFDTAPANEFKLEFLK